MKNLKQEQLQTQKNKEAEEMKNLKFWEQEAEDAKKALRIINLQIGGSDKVADLRLLEQKNGEIAWMLNEAGNVEEAEIYLKRAEYYKNSAQKQLQAQKNKEAEEMEKIKQEQLQAQKNKEAEEMEKINESKIKSIDKKEEEQKMEKEINETLQTVGELINEMRETVRSLDIDMNRKFDSYIEKQEKFIEIEKRKRHFLKIKMDLLKDALEKIKEYEHEDLSIDTQMKIYAAKNRLKDVCAKHTNSYVKIKHTENIIKEERKKEK